MSLALAPAVLTERLIKSYGRSRSRGIVDLDLEVRYNGEVFGFLGPTGPARPRRSGSCWT